MRPPNPPLAVGLLYPPPPLRKQRPCPNNGRFDFRHFGPCPAPARVCVSVVVCVTRRRRPCPSCGGRRDRIGLGLLRSYYKGGGGRDASEGKRPQRRPQRRLGRRLEEVAKAVGGGYCRLQMPSRLALGVRGTVAGHRLGALEEGGGGKRSATPSPPSGMRQLSHFWGGGGGGGASQGAVSTPPLN